MKHNNYERCALAIFFFAGTFPLLAQESIAPSGGNAKGTGGTASYTVGQMVYTTNNGTTGSIAQGVQQGYSISVISSQTGTENIICTVYPNPAADYLLLDVSGLVPGKLHFQLTDMTGRTLENGETLVGKTRIDLHSLAQDSYTLSVTDGSKILKSFQIIKN